MQDIEPGNLRALVGENVRYIRQEQGLSQDALADRASIHRTYLVRLESTDGANITLDVLEALAEALEVAPSKLLKDDLTD